MRLVGKGKPRKGEEDMFVILGIEEGIFFKREESSHFRLEKLKLYNLSENLFFFFFFFGERYEILRELLMALLVVGRN